MPKTVGTFGVSAPQRSSAQRLSDRFRPFFLAHQRALHVVLYAAAIAGAWTVRFVEDDAFISFRYAKNLALGNGLVFNPGERVEGYTNFLWTVLMAIPERFGWSTPMFSQVLGIACMLATLTVAHRLARNTLKDDALAYIAMVVLLTNMTFLAYATSGLETMLQTLLVTSVIALLLPVERALEGNLVLRRVGAGALGGLALLTRLDSAVLVGTAVVVHLVLSPASATGVQRVRAAIVPATQIGLPFAAIVLPWLGWKWAYYGSLLPNTLAAKTAGSPIWPMLFGLLYLATYLVGYFLFVLVGAVRSERPRFRSLGRLRQVLWLVPVWLLYVVVVGADFMEFRFLVAITPLIALVITVLLDAVATVMRQVTIATALLFASIGHMILPSLGYPITTFHDLAIWPAPSPYSLASMGQRLAETFPGGLDKPGQVTMAFGSLGALPYYSQLPTVDMLGLTDPYVARNGEAAHLYYPGHLRMAPIDYLVKRRINLVTSVRITKAIDPNRDSYRLSDLVAVYPVVDLTDLPESARVVEIPIDEHNAWIAIYLTKHPAIDKLIANEQWRELPIERRCVNADIPELARLFGTKTCV